MKAWSILPSIIFPVCLFVGSAHLASAFPQYYDISERDKAQAEAKDRQLPLAWFGAYPSDLNPRPLAPGESWTDRTQLSIKLTQQALTDLQDQAVVVYFDATNMAPVPQNVHAQLHIQDDGPLEGGANWDPPKIVFTNAQVTRILGRVSHTQIKEEGDSALNSALQLIKNDPNALADDPPPAPPTPPAALVPPVAPPAVVPAAVPEPATPAPLSSATEPVASTVNASSPSLIPPTSPLTPDEASDDADDLSPDERAGWDWLKQNYVYVGIALAAVLLALHGLSRRPAT